MRKMLVALAGSTLVVALALPAGASTVVPLPGGGGGSGGGEPGAHRGHDVRWPGDDGGQLSHSRWDRRGRHGGRHHRHGRDRYCDGNRHRYYDYDYDDYDGSCNRSGCYGW
jgi:hypothetical protein